MNVRAAQRYTETIASLGTTPIQVSLSDFGGPPVQGGILSVKVERTAGPATLVTTRVREGASGDTKFESTDDPMPGPVTIYAVPIPHYTVGLPTDLKLEVVSDDGTFGTTVDVTVELRGPE